MRSYLILLKNTLINGFRPSGKVKNIGGYVLIILLLGGVFGFVIGGSVVMVSGAFINHEMQAEFLTVLFLVSQFVTLVFGTVAMAGSMFDAKDSEITLALPVKPATVFFVKLTYVYLTELVLTLFVTMVAGSTFGVICAYSPMYYVQLFLCCLLLPVLPLLISALIITPVMHVISFFKRRGLFTGIFMCLVFIVFMVLYYVVFSSITGSADDEGMIALVLSPEAAALIRSIVGWVIPDIALARFVLSVNPFVNLLIALGIYAVLGFFAWLISSKLYYRSVSSTLEQGRQSAKGKAEYRVRSLKSTLFKKELSGILRHPYLLFYCAMQVFMPSLMILLFTATTGMVMGTADLGVYGSSVNQLISLAYGFMLCGMVGLGSNYTALSSVTREAENFDLIKTYPVAFELQMQVKAQLAVIFNALTVATGLLVMAFMLKMNALDCVFLLAALLLLGDGLGHYGCMVDLKRPKLKYDNISYALKNNTNSLRQLGMTALMVLPGMILVCGISALGMLGTDVTALKMISWCVLLIGYALFSYLVKKRFYTNVYEKIMRIEA